MRKKPKRVPQDRQFVKITVRMLLGGRYWPCFLACLLPALLSLIISFIPVQFGMVYFEVVGVEIPVAISLPLQALSFIGAAFVTGPMTVRLAGFFLQLNRDAEQLPSPLTVCDCFGPGYWRLVGGMLLRSLDVLVCTAIPLVIGALVPGTWEAVEDAGATVIRLTQWALPFLLLSLALNLYRSLAYAMVPYLLQDEPRLSSVDALRASLRMTRGRIVELLVLNLSFLGWLMLASFAFVMAGLFFLPFLLLLSDTLGATLVYPYIEGTMAAYYIGFSEPMPWEVSRTDALG